MRRATKKCETCPFRGASDDYKKSSAHIQPDAWPCHTEDYMNDELEIQCRGHWQAVAKYGDLIGPQADSHDLNSNI